MSTTRSRIVAAAQQVIASDGWGAATTRRIAEAAEVKPGVVHYHVGNIDELRREAVLGGVTAYFDELRRLSEEEDVGHQLATMIRSIASTDATSQEALLLYASLSAAAHDNALRDAINAQIAELRQVLTAHTDTGRAQLIAAALDGLIMQRAFGIDIDEDALIPAVRRILDVSPAG